MKIARSKDTVKLTLSKAEWELLGKQAGWGGGMGMGTDPALDVGGFNGGLGNRGGYGLHGGGSSTMATEEGDGLTDIDNGGVDNTVDDGANAAGTPGTPEGDTFLNVDPNAKPVEPSDPGVDVNDDISSEQGAGDAINDGWQSHPHEPGDYTMTTDEAGELEQKVYWDGSKLHFEHDPNPHDISEVAGAKFKLHSVDEPDSDIPSGHGGIHGVKAPPLDVSDAPF